MIRLRQMMTWKHCLFLNNIIYLHDIIDNKQKCIFFFNKMARISRIFKRVLVKKEISKIYITYHINIILSIRYYNDMLHILITFFLHTF